MRQGKNHTLTASAPGYLATQRGPQTGTLAFQQPPAQMSALPEALQNLPSPLPTFLLPPLIANAYTPTRLESSHLVNSRFWLLLMLFSFTPHLCSPPVSSPPPKSLLLKRQPHPTTLPAHQPLAVSCLQNLSSLPSHHTEWLLITLSCVFYPLR